MFPMAILLFIGWVNVVVAMKEYLVWLTTIINMVDIAYKLQYSISGHA